MENIDFKKSLSERVEQFRKFYTKSNERPLLGFYRGSEYPLFRYQAPQSLPEKVALTPDNFPVEDYLDDYDRLFGEHEACGGDFIWSGSIYWGIPWLEAVIGCPIYANHSTGSIYSRPPSWFDGPESLPGFDPKSPWNQKAKEFLEKMSERSNGRWPIGTTRMRGISDLLSALYGLQELVFAMQEKPDEVKEVCKKLTEIWIEFGRMQLDNIPLYHGGVGSFYYYLWAPKGTIWHQEDTVALLSPDLYKEFIEPYDQQIVNAFDGCIMHQHTTGYLPLEDYLNLGFAALELHIDEGGPSAEELYDKHMKILQQAPLIIWGDISETDMDWLFNNLPYQGLAIITVVSNPEESYDIWRRYIQENPEYKQ